MPGYTVGRWRNEGWSDNPVFLKEYQHITAGLKAMAMGFRKLFGDRDLEKLEAQIPLYDALYAWCQAEVTRPAP